MSSPAPSPRPPFSPGAGSAAPVSAGTRVRERILVIDDETNIRSTLAEFMALSGYEVDTAQDGAKGMDLLGSRDYDLVLLDLRMPGMDGLAVTEWIRETHPDVPVIVMTGHATVESSIKALRLGAYDYVQKPFSLDEIERTIGNCLEKRRLERRNTELTILNERLREIERIKDDLLATVSHEFRTPLTAIHGFLSLARERGHVEPDRASAPGLDAIWDNVNRLDAMIANLLGPRGVAGPRVSADPGTDSARSVLPRIREPSPCIRVCAMTFASRSTRPRGHFRASWIDAAFRSCLHNLIDNAFKFCRDPGTAEVLRRGASRRDSCLDRSVGRRDRNSGRTRGSRLRAVHAGRHDVDARISGCGARTRGGPRDRASAQRHGANRAAQPRRNDGARHAPDSGPCGREVGDVTTALSQADLDALLSTLTSSRGNGRAATAARASATPKRSPSATTSAIRISFRATRFARCERCTRVSPRRSRRNSRPNSWRISRRRSRPWTISRTPSS